MRVAINLLTDDPANPSGAHWFWTRMIPEMAQRLDGDEELRLLISPKSRSSHSGYGAKVGQITFPWSNENPKMRTLTEHVYAPIRLPISGIDVFSTLFSPIIRPAKGLVVHIKTMHAHTEPEALRLINRVYRKLSLPRTVKVADAVILNSESLRIEVHRYLDVDPAKVYLIPEAVDHELFTPGDRDEARAYVKAAYNVTKPFVLFVSSLWRYKNPAGLIRGFAAAKQNLGDRQLVLVGPDRDKEYCAELRALADELGVSDDLVWVGGVPLAETVQFYRSADVFAYPSFNETFGLPILEAMACGCPVITSNTTAMPETAGDAALLVDPSEPESIADALGRACGAENARLRAAGPERAALFTWGECAERTLNVYRQVHLMHQEGGKTR